MGNSSRPLNRLQAAGTTILAFLGMLPYAFTILVLVIITQRRIIVSSPDPVSAIVCAASGADVDTVVIDGKIVVQSGAVSAVPR